MFHTFVTRDEENNERLSLDLVPHSQSPVTSLISNIKILKELTVVKKVHQITHADADEMASLFEDAGMMNVKIQKAMNKISKACNICSSTVRPVIRKELSLQHVNDDFNSEIEPATSLQELMISTMRY